MVKKLFLLFVAGMFCFGTLAITGCTSEWYKHDTVFKNWDHIAYSWWGYQNPTEETCQQSNDEGWWGDAHNCDGMPYIPAE